MMLLIPIFAFPIIPTSILLNPSSEQFGYNQLSLLASHGNGRLEPWVLICKTVFDVGIKLPNEGAFVCNYSGIQAADTKTILLNTMVEEVICM